MEIRALVDVLWIAVSAALVFFMQAGFAMVESGLTRTKNSINVAIKNLTDLGISVLVFWVVGFALMFGDSISGLAGWSGFLPDLGTIGWSATAFFLFQVMFCSTSATIVSGAVAERMRYSSYIASTAFMAAVVYPIFGHWAWGGLGGGSSGSGWLASIGFVDFAGSTVVHSVGGYVSLAALLILGPRTGRYGPDGKVAKIQGSNIPLSVAGVLVLWFGWIGFNGGSTLAMNEQVPLIIVNTCAAAAAGMVSALLAGWLLTRIPDVNFVMNGTLAGLVAITACCHCVTVGESVLIGAAAGIIMLACSALLDKLRIDDAVGAIPVHLAGGIWGTLAVALFGDPDILGPVPGGASRVLVQLAGIGACALWSFGSSFIFLFALNAVCKMRVTEQEEKDGLNIAEHGATTDLVDLYTTMDEQARTGNLSLRVPVEPFTEIGQIAALYNRVMAGLEQNTIAKDEYEEIFANVSDGLFLIDRDLRICPNFSAATVRIFGTKDLAGKKVTEVVESMVSPDKSSRFRDFIALMFDRQHHERSITAMNPLTATHFRVSTGYGRTEPRLLDFSFVRIWNAGKTAIPHVLAIARDNTRLADVSAELRKARAKLDLLEARPAGQTPIVEESFSSSVSRY